MNYQEKYQLWLDSPYIDNTTKDELRAISDNKEIEDRFYKDLEFGTGGLRGVIGAGSNRMNIYSVGKATQGLAQYIKKQHSTNMSAVISYDPRIMSKEFAEAVALILCANDIKVSLFDSLRPAPVLSFAVRELKCSIGIMITASHNPKQYNGYKVYGSDGGQVTDEAANEILSCVKNIDSFTKVQSMSIGEAVSAGTLCYIGEDIDKVYIDSVKNLTIRSEMVEKHASDLKVIYTPIHGTGNIPVRRVLSEMGYTKVHVVKEQEKPDGSFPTAAYPNPEDPKVFKIALEMAKSVQPDIIFGTDPDCDRIGVVVKDKTGKYKVLTGNQTGALLTQYILESLQQTDKLPENGVVIKTIVTTDLAVKIVNDYGRGIIDVLTGFKYIGEKMKEFEESGSNTFLFGFEESFGYLAGNFVRDKDAVIASMLICEMALFYKNKKMSLDDALSKLYEKYGFYKEELISMELQGKEGAEKIAKALEYLRDLKDSSFNGVEVVKKIDYKTSIEKDIAAGTEKKLTLPKSNVLKFVLNDESWFVVRPSGTEPKMKIYLSVVGSTQVFADQQMEEFKKTIKNLIDKACNV